MRFSALLFLATGILSTTAMNITGRIYCASPDNAVAEAKITIQDEDATLGSTVTDEDGAFSLQTSHIENEWTTTIKLLHACNTKRLMCMRQSTFPLPLKVNGQFAEAQELDVFPIGEVYEEEICSLEFLPPSQ